MTNEKHGYNFRGSYRVYNRKLTQEDLDAIMANPYALYEPISSPRYWPIRPFWKRLFYRIKGLFTGETT